MVPRPRPAPTSARRARRRSSQRWRSRTSRASAPGTGSTVAVFRSRRVTRLSMSSPNITVGTPTANGAPAQGTGSIRIDVCPVPGCAAPNVRLEGHARDVRCKAGNAACGARQHGRRRRLHRRAARHAQVRITDHNNDTTPRRLAARTWRARPQRCRTSRSRSPRRASQRRTRHRLELRHRHDG